MGEGERRWGWGWGVMEGGGRVVGGYGGCLGGAHDKGK